MAAARPPPALIDDLVMEILLRLPPDDIASLARASLVCRAWRRHLSDHAFRRRYREIHGAAPMLGFIYNNYSTDASCPLFLRTTQQSPFSSAASGSSPTYCRAIDCRHGRVLLQHPGYYYSYSYSIWDPITGKKQCFPGPLHPYYLQYDVAMAMLCASDGCDHIDCSGGPFLVVSLETTCRREGWQLGSPWPVEVPMAQTCLYSSETGKWGVSASIDFDSFSGTFTPSLVTRDTVFFLIVANGSRRILKYDMTRRVLSAISVPPTHQLDNMILCTTVDGDLGVAAVLDSSLCLFSGRTDSDGVTRWEQDRAIKLDSMIPCGVGGASTKFCVVGFAEGSGYIFVRANNSIFIVEQKSGRISKIGSGKFFLIFPFMRFGHSRSCYSQVAYANED